MAKNNENHIGVRLPKDLLVAFNRFKDKTNGSNKDIVCTALRQYLDCPEPLENAPKESEILNTRIDGVYQELSSAIEALNNRLKELEKHSKQKSGEAYKGTQLEAFPSVNETVDKSVNTNTERFPKHLKYERPMGESIKGGRAKLKKYRLAKNLIPSQQIPDDALTSEVEGELCHLWVWEMKPRGKGMTCTWAAHPVNKIDDKSVNS